MTLNRYPSTRSFRLPAIALILAALGTAASIAQTNVDWDAAVDGNFSDDTKWTSGTSPDNTENAAFNQAGDYTVTLDTSTSVANLDVNSGNVVFSGVNTLAVDNTLSVEAGASISLSGGANINTVQMSDTGTGVVNVSGNGSMFDISDWSVFNLAELNVNSEGAFNILNGEFGDTTVNVDGTGSTFGVSDWVNFASSELNLTDGGGLNMKNGRFGDTSVNIDGFNSSLNIDTWTSFGREAFTDVRVTNGGALSTNGMNIGREASGSATLYIDGTSSFTDSTNGVSVGAHGSTGQIDLDGSMSVKTANVGFDSGSGTMNIESTGSVIADNFQLGIAGGTGTVNLNGGTIDAKSVYVSIGTLTNTGGTINTEWLSNRTGNIIIEEDGVINATMGATIRSTASLTLDNGSLLTETLTNEGTITNNGGSINTVNFENLGVFEQNDGNFNATGDILIKGSTTFNDNNSPVNFGNGTTSVMNILEGGTLILNPSVGFATAASSNLTLNVDGAGSSVIAGYDVNLAANGGVAEVNISNGGSVSFEYSNLAQGADSSLTVNVDGNNSSFNPGAWVPTAGEKGAAEFYATNGGDINFGGISVGNNGGSLSFSADGSGSSVNFSGWAGIGYHQTGGSTNVEIVNGATMNIDGGSRIAAGFSDSGALLINGTGSQLNFATIATTASLNLLGSLEATVSNGGAINGNNMKAGSLNFLATGNGTEVNLAGTFIADANVSFENSATLNTTELYKNNASTILSVNSGAMINTDTATFTEGTTTIGTGSTINATTSADVEAPATVTLNGGTLSTASLTNAGTINGSGTLNTASVVNSGLIDVGSSPGTITINGDFTQTETGTLRIEGGDGSAGLPGIDFDQLTVLGNASLNGLLDLSLADGYTAAEGDSFTFLNVAGGISGGFAEMAGLSLDGGLAFESDVNGGQFNFVVMAEATDNEILDGNRSGEVKATGGEISNSHVVLGGNTGQSGVLNVTGDSSIGGGLTVGGNGGGSLNIEGGSSLSTEGSVEVGSSGQIDIGGGSLNAGGGLTNEGIITGTGTVEGEVTNNGTIAVGNSPGSMTFTNHVTLLSDSVLDIEIGGFGGAGASDGHDFLSFNGGVDLNGMLNIILLDDSIFDSFAPENTWTFEILNLTSFTGSFSSINGLNLTGDWYFKTIVSNDTYSLQLRNSTVPDGGATFAMLAFALFGTIIAIRRKANVA